MANAMNASPNRPRVNIGGYTLGEEIANSITSGVGTALSLAGLVILVVFAALNGTVWHIVGVSVFGVSLVLSHLASTLYHAIAPPGAKRVLQIFDHLAIYILIAGTYTPFTLVNLRGYWGGWLLGLVWALALCGLLIKLTPLDRVRGLSTGFYIAMGWIALMAIKPLVAHVALGGLLFLIAGGLAYTLGVVFYAWRRLPYNHMIWHLFIIIGGIFHFFAVLLYVVPYGV